MVQRLVVIGGDAAGMSAASQARKRRGLDELEIVAFERGRLHLVLGVRHPLLDRRSRRRPGRPRLPQPRGASPQRDRRAHAHRGRRDRPGQADRAGPGPRRGPRVRRAVRRPRLRRGQRPDAPAGARHRRARACYGVQTLDDGAALRAALDGGARQVVIIGGGYIGLEVAEACQIRGLDVTVVDRAATPIGTFDPDIGRFIADAVRKHRASNLVLSDGVAEIETGDDGRGRRRAHRRRGGGCPPTSSCSGWACGRTSRSPARPGSRSARRGGIAVDHRMRTAGRRGCGRRATASSRSTGSRASGSWSRSARTPTSRAGSRASTSAAATPRSPA